MPFPPEAMILIVADLATKDLLSCALASRSFLPLARETLYREISLTYLDAVKDGSGAMSTSHTFDQNVIQPAKQVHLVQSVTRHSHLADLVRSIVLTFDNAEYSAAVSTELTLRLLLQTCRRVESITFSRCDSSESDAVCGVVAALRPELRKFGPVHLAGSFTSKVMDSQSHIEELSVLVSTKLSDGPEKVPDALRVRLARLKVLRIDGKEIHPVTFSRLVAKSRESITSLRLILRLGSIHVPDLSVLPALETLSLDLVRASPHDFFDTVEPLCAAISRCRSIKRLRIGIDSTGYDVSSDPRYDAVLASLLAALTSSPILVAIRDRGNTIPLKSITSYISKDASPSLREIWVSADERGSRRPAALAFIAACKAKGIVARNRDWRR